MKKKKHENKGIENKKAKMIDDKMLAPKGSNLLPRLLSIVKRELL